MEKYDIIFVITFIILIFYPLASEIKIGSLEIKKEIDKIRETFLEQITNIRQDIINMENHVFQSNGQNVNINYDETKMSKNDNKSSEDFDKLYREYLIAFRKYSEEVLKAVDMEDFILFMDTNYYKDLPTCEKISKEILLCVKAKTEIRDLIFKIIELFDIKIESLIEGLDKIEAIGLLEERDMLNLKNAYFLLSYTDLCGNYVKRYNYITNILPPILYSLKLFYDNYSSFLELSEEKRKQTILEIKKRNEEDSFWFDDE